MRTAFRTCHLCEATCGLELTIDGDRVVKVRGDDDDVFSHGFLCPKGAAIGDLDADPDRLTQPLVRRDGELVPATWDEAFEVVADRLGPLVAEHGRDAVGFYLGNPNVHNLSGSFYIRPLVKAVGTRNVFSASTVDQMPKHVSSGLMFGSPTAIPVPDIDRTDYLLMLGANPRMSNGSLCTAPDFPGRLDALRDRGGRLVAVDPRVSRTAARADEHVFIRPGTDPYLLLGIASTLVSEDLVDLGALADHVAGLDEIRAIVARYPAAQMSAVCGVPAETITRLARELAAADSAAVYGRIGTTTVPFGTIASWMVDIVNILTGNLDRPGGAMFPLAAHQPAAVVGRPFETGRWHSRVRGLPEALGELPVSTMAEEIETPGEGQIRAMVTVAGNPILSTPNSGRLDAAFASLDFMVSVDPYLNETTRHADVILPPPGALSRPHYDVAFSTLSIRNVANFSPAVLPMADDALDEWEILCRLTAIASGQPAATDAAVVDDLVAGQLVDRAVATPSLPTHGADPDELREAIASRRGPERILDLLLRTGAYGDGFEDDRDGLSLDTLVEHEHGLDLGALEPRIPGNLSTASGLIELAPEVIVADLDRLDAARERFADGGFVLVGRRHLRTNNSWMHNVAMLARGRDLCTLQISEDDAKRLDIADGDRVRVRSRVGVVEVPAEVTPDIMTGVVSLPHGFGHDLDGTRMEVAAKQPGANSNLLTDEQDIDVPSGNAVLNGIPVELEPVGLTG